MLFAYFSHLVSFNLFNLFPQSRNFVLTHFCFAKLLYFGVFDASRINTSNFLAIFIIFDAKYRYFLYLFHLEYV